jgi:hypothetical protein
MAEGKTTIDHRKIKKWAEERGGVPSTVKATEVKGEAGILRLDFKPADDSLAEISWVEFFDKFDSSNLAFLYQEKTQTGRTSRFHKFVERKTQRRASKTATAAKSRSAKATRAKAAPAKTAARSTTAKAASAPKAKAAPARKTAAGKKR